VSTETVATRSPLSAGELSYRATGRIRTVEETVELAWALRHETGISRLADITDLDVLGIPVYNVFRPHAVPLNLTVSSGKGMTAVQSIASGLMEATERHFGESQSLPSTTMTLDDAISDGHPVLDPRRLTPDVRHFPEGKHLFEWVVGESVATGEPIRIPAQAVFTPYSFGGARSYESHSDGLVSGNSRSEALLHGMLELVERDACSFGELLHRGARIDLASAPSSILGLVDTFQRHRIEVDLFQFDSPTGIPVFYAVGVDPDTHSAMLINAGAGCSLDPERGAQRALTELAQSRACVISGSREDFSTRYAGRKAVPLQHALESVRSWLDLDWPTRSWAALPQLATGDLEADVATTAALLRQGGLPDIYQVNLAPDDFPFAILKVIVPGIEYVVESRFRLGPRFYRAAREGGR
jgi:YcaO-like protein with predicted kinase domain